MSNPPLHHLFPLASFTLKINVDFNNYILLYKSIKNTKTCNKCDQQSDCNNHMIEYIPLTTLSE